MNGNPFYVPPVIPDMSDQIMQFGQMAMQKDNLAQQRLLETQKLDSQEKYQTGMLENANKDTAIRQEEAYSKNPNIKPYSNGEYTKLLVQLRTAGIPTDKISFINGPLKEMAQNPDFKRGDVANMMEQKWPEIYNQTSEEVRNEILSLSKKTANMSPMDPKYKEISGQIEKLGQFQSAIDNIKNPKEIFFKDIYDYDQNSKAAIQELRNQNQKPTVLPEGGVLMDSNGKPIYKNPRTFKPTDPDVRENKLDKIKQQGIDKAVRRIDEHIQRHYTIPNQNLEKKLEYKLTDEERQKIEKSIAYNNEQMMIAIGTKNQVLNGEIQPDQVRWGGSGQTKNSDPLGIR